MYTSKIFTKLFAIQDAWVQFLSQEDPLEEGMATHTSIIAWRIPIDRAKPGGLQPMGLQRVEHDWETQHRQLIKIYFSYVKIQTPLNGWQSLLVVCYCLVGQKIHLGFSIWYKRKIQINFLANPIFIFYFVLFNRTPKF